MTHDEMYGLIHGPIKAALESMGYTVKPVREGNTSSPIRIGHPDLGTEFFCSMMVDGYGSYGICITLIPGGYKKRPRKYKPPINVPGLLAAVKDEHKRYVEQHKRDRAYELAYEQSQAMKKENLPFVQALEQEFGELKRVRPNDPDNVESYVAIKGLAEIEGSSSKKGEVVLTLSYRTMYLDFETARAVLTMLQRIYPATRNQ
jgi:hypothetical protein